MSDPRTPGRRQPQQPRAVDCARLRAGPTCSTWRQVVEAEGFDSVWLGDSLFLTSRLRADHHLGRHLAANEAGQARHGLHVSGTATRLLPCPRWATLDHLSGGRTVFGTGWANPEEGVRLEYAARPRLRQARQDLRRGTRGSAPALDRDRPRSRASSSTTMTSGPLGRDAPASPLQQPPSDLDRL